ncbi:MAG: hypothetical protein E7C72_01915 [Dialister sp.]|nr:hypothetical protein [Dialister sp.]
MASFLNFVNTASSVLSDVLGALGGNSDGCTFTLAGGTDSVSFPVSPSNFSVINSYNNTTVNINNLGDVNMLGKRGLSSLRFSSFFPSQSYTFVQTLTAIGPYELVSQIKRMAENRQPCTISISGTDISMPVSIENFEYGEKDSTGDVYFDIELREYRYIMPASSAANSTTALKSRVASTGGDKQTTYLGIEASSLDAAQRAIQKTTTIAKQGQRVLGLYKAMVKSGGVSAGTILTTTAKAVMSNGKSLYTF